MMVPITDTIAPCLNPYGTKDKYIQLYPSSNGIPIRPPFTEYGVTLLLLIVIVHPLLNGTDMTPNERLLQSISAYKVLLVYTTFVNSDFVSLI